MGRHKRDSLGEIHRRAAADRDDAVAALFLVDLERVAHGGFSGILRRAVIERDRHVAGKILLHLGPEAGGNNAPIGHDQRTTDAKQLQFRIEKLQSPEVELDTREICYERHSLFTLVFCPRLRQKKDMSDSLVLRAATLADATVLAATIAAAFAQYRGKLVPESSAFRETPEAITAQLNEGAGAFIVEHDGKVVGCVMTELMDGDLYFGRLAVVPDARGLGIAKRLIEAVEADARRRGLPGVRLGVRIALPANQKLFNSLGYREISREAHPGFDHPTSINMRKNVLEGGPS